jgi:hypothetical protein
MTSSAKVLAVSRLTGKDRRQGIANSSISEDLPARYAHCEHQFQTAFAAVDASGTAPTDIPVAQPTIVEFRAYRAALLLTHKVIE